MFRKNRFTQLCDGFPKGRLLSLLCSHPPHLNTYGAAHRATPHFKDESQNSCLTVAAQRKGGVEAGPWMLDPDASHSCAFESRWKCVWASHGLVTVRPFTWLCAKEAVLLSLTALRIAPVEASQEDRRLCKPAVPTEESLKESDPGWISKSRLSSSLPRVS